MSHSIAPTDTRTITAQQPRLSDDSEVDKQLAVVGRPSNPVPVVKAGAGHAPAPRVSK
jgi:hypothetical protein